MNYETSLGSSADLLIKGTNDYIPMYTRWDGIDDFVIQKLSPKNNIFVFRENLIKFIDEAKNEEQIKFLKEWLESINRFINSEDTIEKFANMLMFGDFNHFYPAWSDLKSYEYDYLIEKVNDKFKLVSTLKDVENRVAYSNVNDSKENIKKSIISEIESSPDRFYNPESSYNTKIVPKKIKDDYLLIRVTTDDENLDDCKAEKFKNIYIKMKSGSVQRFTEIMNVLPFNYAYVLQFGRFSLKANIERAKKNAKARELINNGMEIKEAYKEANKKLIQYDKSLGISDEYAIAAFSAFEHCNMQEVNKAVQSGDLDDIETINRIDSMLPLDLSVDKLIVHLIFFYPDLFESLTKGEVDYIFENNVKEDVLCHVKGQRISQISIELKNVNTDNDFNKELNNVVTFCQNEFKEPIEKIALKIGDKDVLSYSQNDLTINYSFELVLFTVMKAYDKFLLKEYKEGRF